MTIEEKAKAYDEALERAKAYHRNELSGTRKEITEYIFPELRENEDERIRKAIYGTIFCTAPELVSLHGTTKDNALAWLEKQKEQKEKATSTLAKVLEDFAEKFRRLLKTKGIDYVPTNNFWNNIAIAYSKQEKLDFDKWYDDLMIPEEKQKEQKPADKVEPIVDGLETEFQKQVSHLISSAMNREHEYNLGFIQWVAQSLLGYAQHEQKLAGLDEETVTNLDRALCIVKDAKDTLMSYQTDDGRYECDKAIGALENILKNGLQKPAEDEVYPKELESAIKLYYETYGNGKGGFDYMSYPKFEDIVKTFVFDYGQKSAEWSEEDDGVLEQIITAFHRIANGCEHYFSQDTAKVFEETLISLRPQSKARVE